MIYFYQEQPKSQVPSARSLRFDDNLVEKGLVLARNNKRQKNEPLVTPTLTTAIQKLVYLKTMFAEKSKIVFSKFPEIMFCFNFNISP